MVQKVAISRQILQPSNKLLTEKNIGAQNSNFASTPKLPNIGLLAATFAFLNDNFQTKSRSSMIFQQPKT